MLSTDIEKYMKNDISFMGCYAKDRLPKVFPKKFPKKIIVNTGHSSTSGEHWVALLLHRENCFYFDSFGIEIVDGQVLEFIKKCYKQYTFNSVCIQHYKSKKCGEFCIAFLKLVNSKKQFKTFINMFSLENLKCNDKKLSKILKLFNR